MSTKLNPYLGFRDTAKEAMEFYQSDREEVAEVAKAEEFAQLPDSLHGGQRSWRSARRTGPSGLGVPYLLSSAASVR